MVKKKSLVSFYKHHSEKRGRGFLDAPLLPPVPPCTFSPVWPSSPGPGQQLSRDRAFCKGSEDHQARPPRAALLRGTPRAICSQRLSSVFPPLPQGGQTLQTQLTQAKWRLRRFLAVLQAALLLPQSPTACSSSPSEPSPGQPLPCPVSSMHLQSPPASAHPKPLVHLGDLQQLPLLGTKTCYYSAWVAITKRQTKWLQQWNVFSHGSAGWEIQGQGLGGLGSQRSLPPSPSPAPSPHVLGRETG